MGDAVEEGVGALAREVADGGGVDSGLQHPGPDAVQAEGVSLTMPYRVTSSSSAPAAEASAASPSSTSNVSSTGWYSTIPMGSRSRNWSSRRIIASDTCSRMSSVGSPMSSGTIIDAARAGSGTGPSPVPLSARVSR